ncbi:hypothetical protein HDU92_000513, partial [Lobulomyces angularis]
ISLIEETAVTLFEAISNYLKHFFERDSMILDLPKEIEALNDEPKYDGVVSYGQKSLDAAIYILQYLFSNSIFKNVLITKNAKSVDIAGMVKELLQDSIVERFKIINTIASSNNASNHPLTLEKLSKLMLRDIKVIKDVFNELILDFVHLPSMMSSFYFNIIQFELEKFELVSFHSENDLSSMFALYTNVNILKNLIETIDFRISNKFRMDFWFFPFIKKWLGLTETKLLEWVNSAIKIDDWTPISEQTPYSSSLYDINVCFQQQISFLEQLSWPNKKQLEIFYRILFE